MKRYQVLIEEQTRTTVHVYAETEDEARSLAEQQFLAQVANVIDFAVTDRTLEIMAED